MKKTIFLFAILGIVLTGCNKEEPTPEPEPTPTPTPTPTTATFKITSDGTYTVATGDFSTVTGGAIPYLQFAFYGSKNGVYNGGNIWFPNGSVSGTYNVNPDKNSLAANEVALDMASTADHTVNVAQSGTVTLTVSGTKYTIKFTDLPTLTNNGTNQADLISANLFN
jgi:hypothetical protein